MSVPAPVKLACVAALGLIAAAANAQLSITQVPPLPGQWGSNISGISNDGTIVSGQSFPSFGSGTRGIRWTLGGGTADLGLPSGIQEVYTYGISADGSVIAGAVLTTSSNIETARWTSGTGVQNLGSPGGSPNSNALSVSGDGQVLTSNRFPQGYRWTSGGGFVAVPPAGVNHDTVLFAANSDGSIVGGASGPSGGQLATIWTGATPTVIGALPGDTRSDVRGMSADGSVLVGISSTPSNSRAFRYAAGVMTQIGGPSAFFSAVSDDGSVIGGQNLGRGHIWSQSLGLVNLNTYLPSIGLDLTGWILGEVTALSADGNVIAGNGQFEGVSRGYVVVLPAPGSAALLGLGAVLAARRRRSR